MAGASATNRYDALIERVFFSKYRSGRTEVSFLRTDLEAAARKLGIRQVKNLGDAIYAFRFRLPLPESIRKTQPRGKEWVIELRGRGKYAFALQEGPSRILPREDLVAVKIPDSTPEIVRSNALSDEQALLAIVRYNRLVDVFLGIATYSLQNHLRTTVEGMGQVEIDELYVGVDGGGRQFVVPVQAKGGTDQLSTVQARQDIACCEQRFAGLICRPVSAQFLDDDKIALFELGLDGGRIGVVQEKHYRLVPGEEITPEDLAAYSKRSRPS